VTNTHHRDEHGHHGAGLEQIDVLVQRGLQNQGAEALIGEEELHHDDPR
jgi:hypothetical protein